MFQAIYSLKSFYSRIEQICSLKYLLIKDIKILYSSRYSYQQTILLSIYIFQIVIISNFC
jgi:hypothetical protein